MRAAVLEEGLRSLEGVPERARVRRGRTIVLARGEVTGHAHRVVDARAPLWTDGPTGRFLVILGEEPVTLEQ